MSMWQADTLSTLREALPDAEIEVYGSMLEPASTDSWSDLDVMVRVTSPVSLEAALGAPLWAWQSVQDGDEHVVRAVLDDGRRVDLTITGAEGLLPDQPADNDIRFDATLAAVKFGRGSHLIGLHLTLGIIRESLVQWMVAADRQEGTAQHPHATALDDRAVDELSLLRVPAGPATARAAYEHYCAARAAVEPGFVSGLEGLDAMIVRGSGRAG